METHRPVPSGHQRYKAVQKDLLAIDVDVTILDMLKPAAREAVHRLAVPL